MGVVIAVAVLLIVTVTVQIWVMRRPQRALDTGAIAERWVVPGKPFELHVPDGPAVELMMLCTVEQHKRSRTGWAVRIEGTRPPPEGAYRAGAAPFKVDRECIYGSYVRPKNVFPAREIDAVDRTAVARRVTTVSRLAEVPEGGAFVVRGEVFDTAVGMDLQSLSIFARPRGPA